MCCDRLKCLGNLCNTNQREILVVLKFALPAPDKLRALDRVDVTHKRVLLRVDYNVPLDDTGSPELTLRMEETLPTLEALLARGARVGILTHRGRPQGRPTPALTTAPLARWVQAALKQRGVATTVTFVPDCVGRVAQHAMDALAPGHVLMFENTRFHLGEQLNQMSFVHQLAQLGDVMVYDAFACAHRAQASSSGLAHLLPTVLGYGILRELSWLHGWEHSQRPRVMILGGNQVLPKLDLLSRVLGHVDIVMLGGVVGLTMLAAKDLDMHQSRVDFGALELARHILAEAGVLGCRLHLPRDMLVAALQAPQTSLGVRAPHQLGPQELAADIGPTTLDMWARLVQEGAYVAWLGCLGHVEYTDFATGTLGMARALRARDALTQPSLLGGNGLERILHDHHMLGDLPAVSGAGLALQIALGGQPLAALQFLQSN
jgi:3-phosphoglycerate kinase